MGQEPHGFLAADASLVFRDGSEVTEGHSMGLGFKSYSTDCQRHAKVPDLSIYR